MNSFYFVRFSSTAYNLKYLKINHNTDIDILIHKRAIKDEYVYHDVAKISRVNKKMNKPKFLDLGFVLHGTRQQGAPALLRELILLDGSEPVSPRFTGNDTTTELSGPRLTSCRTEMYL
ncbi:unnamed protein product [Schistosoma margrebowiei]|uniref:Uncharacterized protein n=1 Tax=Schistosoma margrebowiei TaxID=48269 RepID=A0A183M221_9TREM|nr:unnamed protein product [Schistosoma margrebowiei]